MRVDGSALNPSKEANCPAHQERYKYEPDVPVRRPSSMRSMAEANDHLAGNRKGAPHKSLP